MSTEKPSSDEPEDQQSEQPEESEKWLVMEAEAPPLPPPPQTLIQELSEKCETPVFAPLATRLFVDATRNGDASDRIPTPVVLGSNVGKRIANIDIPLCNDPERQNPEMDETFRTLDELLRSHATGQKFHDKISALMSATDTKTAQKIWTTSLLYLQEIVEQVVSEIERRLQEGFKENDILYIFQHCWERVISKEGKIFLLEKIRELIKKSKEEHQTKLFWALVLSINNSIRRQQDTDEESVIKIPANIREKFPHADIAENISPLKLLPIDENYIQIHEQLGSNRAALLKLLERNPFMDEIWEELIKYGSTEDYIKMCERLYMNAIKEIDTISEDKDDEETVILSEETVELYERAWNEVIYPRLLIWEEILHSNLLLPH